MSHECCRLAWQTCLQGECACFELDQGYDLDSVAFPDNQN
jgi:hypothetical protein